MIMQGGFRTQRILMWLAIVSGLVFFAGYVLTGMFPPPSPSLDAAQVAQLYAQHNMRLRIGVVVCLIGGGFWVPWSIALAIQMARLEEGAPGWAIIQFLTGTMGSVFYVLPALFWGAAAFYPSQHPALVTLMNEVGFLMFVTPVSFYWLQTLSIAMVSLSKTRVAHSAFPRWIGFFSLFTMVCTEMGVIAQLFNSGPFSWNGIFPFWIPLSVAGVWFIAISVSVLRAITMQENAAKGAGVTAGRE